MGNQSAESEEGRPLIKENTHQSSTHPTQSEVRVSQGLAGVRSSEGQEGDEVHRSAPPYDSRVCSGKASTRFEAESCPRSRRRDVDRSMKPAGRVALLDLHSRVHRGAYRAQPSRRVYIPKADGRKRPLGIAALEDKIVQHAVVTILNQIYEVDFRGFSLWLPTGTKPASSVGCVDVGIERKE